MVLRQLLCRHKDFLLQLFVVIAISFYLFFSDYFFLSYYYREQLPRYWIGLLETFLIFSVISLAFQRTFFFVMSFLAGLTSLIQLFHVSYFGRFIHPSQLWLFFTQNQEAVETIREILNLTVVPGAIFLIFLFLIFFLSKKYPQKIITIPYLKYLVIVALVYAPVRTAITKNPFGRQPKTYSLSYVSFYASVSYFLGRVLPFKMTHHSKISQKKISVAKVKEHPDINIVFIIGESLRAKNLPFFGYERNTMPFLSSLNQKGELFLRKTISNGVITDVSVPMLFNLASGNDIQFVLSQERCLFRLAKNNGFETHFITALGQKVMGYIMSYACNKYLDQSFFKGSEQNIEGSHSYDNSLLKDFDAIDWNKNNLVVYHQNGSHSPYHIRYPKEFEKYPRDIEDHAQSIINSYDNSILYTDFILESLYKEISKRSKKPTYFVYTSDHGQSLGEDGAWGHLFLKRPIYVVPTFVWASSKNLEKIHFIKTWPKIIAHEDIYNLLLYLLGYEYAEDVPKSRVLTVVGTDLDGSNGVYEVRIKDEKIDSERYIPAE